MSGIQRRDSLTRLARWAAWATLGASSLGGASLIVRQARASEPDPDPVREITVEARRFAFLPAEITLRLGERVVLRVHSLDYVHGFHVPLWGVRADLLPGQVTSVPLQALTLGKVPFLCDNFCGSGHEDMSGRFIVSA